MDLVEHAGHALQRFGGHRKQPVALTGELDRAVQAMEQAGAEGLFQKADLLAHCRLGDPQFLSGEGKTAEPGDGLEHQQGRHRRDQAPVAFDLLRELVGLHGVYA